MTGETRQIGGYNCFKAIAVVPTSASDFRNFRMKKTDDEKKKRLKRKTRRKKQISWMGLKCQKK